MSKGKKLISTTIIAATVASLCCITPILALIAGTTGFASTFSWIEPFRPYLIAFTILVLLLAWYQKFKSQKQEIDCDCDCEEERAKLINSKKFLLFVTLFAGLMLAFPYYSQIFYPNTSKVVVYVKESNISEVEYNIKGMTCSGCEVHIESEVNKLKGIILVKANHEKGNTFVKYDKTKVANNEIKDAVKKTGYKIID
jgi:mercuric ion transport protein